MRALITKYAGTEAAAVHSPSMEERIFLVVIVSAMAVLVGSATMLVFGPANSVALVRQPQQQAPVTRRCQQLCRSVLRRLDVPRNPVRSSAGDLTGTAAQSPIIRGEGPAGTAGRSES